MMEILLIILAVICVPIFFVTIFFAEQLYDRYRPVLMVTVTTTQTWNRKKTKHLLSYDIRYRIQDGKRKARVHSLFGDGYEFMPNVFKPGSFCGQIAGSDVGPCIEGFMRQLAEERPEIRRFYYHTNDCSDITFFGNYLKKRFRSFFIKRDFSSYKERQDVKKRYESKDENNDN